MLDRVLVRVVTYLVSILVSQVSSFKKNACHISSTAAKAPPRAIGTNPGRIFLGTDASPLLGSNPRAVSGTGACLPPVCVSPIGVSSPPFVSPPSKNSSRNETRVQTALSKTRHLRSARRVSVSSSASTIVKRKRQSVGRVYNRDWKGKALYSTVYVNSRGNSPPGMRPSQDEYIAMYGQQSPDER